MTHTLPGPGFAGLLTHWAWQPIAIAAAAALSLWYLSTVRRVRSSGQAWRWQHSAVFALGIGLLVWTSCGWPEAYRSSLYWVWTAQTLTLLLMIPLVILAGQPLQLARLASGGGGAVERFLHSRLGTALANPLIGPALVPLLSAVLFFGPLPSWAVQWPALAWVVQLLLLVIGAFVVLPLVGPDESPSSLAVGLSLAIGSFELVLDAVPGIALRLHASLVTTYFDHRTVRTWSPPPVHDQQIAGTILWCVAEVIDLPFLLLVYRRWLRADARDAAQVDAVLDAERLSRAGLATEEHPGTPDDADAPWWLTDPAMQRRYRGETH